MLSTDLGLRPASQTPISCKICDGDAALYGVVDLQRPCEFPGGARPPLSGVPVYYRRCPQCSFLFTDAFDDWNLKQFKTHIYNDGYQALDPEGLKRPSSNADVVANLWTAFKTEMRVLDFGTGEDTLCSVLRARGFKDAVACDAMAPDQPQPPQGKFDLVTCFETLEHMPDPVAAVARIVEYVAEPGAVLYSTLTQPDDFERQGMSWWFVGPRSGNISIFSKQALAFAWARYGYRTVSFNPGTHLAFRTLPKSWGLTSLQS
jgi:hypothetical protein